METRIFQIAFLASFAVHAVFLASAFATHVRTPQKDIKKLEVVYEALTRVSEQEPPPPSPTIAQKTPWKPNPEVLTRREVARLPVMKEQRKQPVRLRLSKKQTIPAGAAVGKRHITVPMLESEKISNPEYSHYNEQIRRKIHSRAQRYIQGEKFQEGDVYLTFVLMSNGSLRQVKIIDAKTRANDYLRGIAFRSIKESQPFPAFPGSLKYPELSFNVIISFKIDH